MKRILTVLGLFLVLTQALFSQKDFMLNNSEEGIKVKSINSKSLEISIQLKDIRIEKKKINGQYFLIIENNLTEKIQGKGEPMLPVIKKMIEVPAGAQVKIKDITYSSYKIDLTKEFGNIPILPAQPPMRKDIAEKNFLFDKKMYNLDQLISRKIADVKILGWLRNIRLGELTIKPFNYNPRRNILTVYDNINIILEFQNPDWTKTNEIKQHYTSPIYQFKDITINRLPRSKDLLQNLPLKMIIITPDEFITYGLMQFVQMKEQQGFDVVIVPTSQIGNDTASIRNWLKNYYETNAHPQDFVLFVGDVDKLPSWDQRTQDQHVTDLYYCEYTGDYLPEVYWGRFPVDDTTQLWNIVQKTIAYEKLQLANTDYLQTALLVAGNDENMEDTYGNGQVYYGETNYFNSNNGINGHALYQDPPAGASYHDTIINLINQGCGFANYSAHCSPEGWADPSFSRTDLTSSLTNNKLYGVWIGNCCQSNKFDEEDAFSEIALYSPNKGAAAYIGGSDYTYWDEDYWWAVGYTQSIVSNPSYSNTEEGAFDGYFHTLGNEVNDPSKWFITTAQMIWAGNLAVEQSTSNLKHYYWEIYQVMGDPSLIPFIGPVQTISITANNPIIKGLNQVSLATSPYTYLTVYQDGQRIGVGISDANGYANITTNEAVNTDSLDIFGYGQNKTPIHVKLGTVDPNFPISKTTITNTTINFASNGTFYITVENTNDTTSIDKVYIKLTSLDPANLSLDNDSIFIGSLAAAATDTFTVNYTTGIVPDMTEIPIITQTTQIYNNDTVILNKRHNITIYAGKPQISKIIINDDNHSGTLDSDESGTIDVKITNAGHTDINNLNVEISAIPELVHFADNPKLISILHPKDTITISYSFSCDTFSQSILGNISLNMYNDLYNDSLQENIWFNQPQYITLSDADKTTSDYPFNNYWKYGETQVLIRKEEISKLKIINEIGFKFANTTPDGYYLKNFRIAFLNTNINELSSWLDTSNFTTVYNNSDQYISDFQGWHYFHLSDWQIDTTQNLVILITWGDNPDYVSQTDAFSVYAGNPEFTSVLYKNYDYVGGGSDEYNISTLRPAMKIGVSEISAINNIPVNQQINIYPNPAHDYLHITLPSNSLSAQAEVINTQGQVVMRGNLTGTRLNIKSLTPGIYLLRIYDDNKIYTAKFVKE